jgi:8-oxo-dGTP pyrophosphatase MutT (NUDIX family)
MVPRHMKTYQLSAGVIIVRWIAGQPHYLLLRAYNFWDFPKGLVEENEDPFEAAQREVTEETGLTDLRFRWGKVYYETGPYGAGKIARYYLAESTSGNVFLPVNPLLGRPEHEEFRWVTYDQAQSMLTARLKPILNKADWKVLRNQEAQG